VQRAKGVASIVGVNDVVDRLGDAGYRTIHPDVITTRRGVLTRKIERVGIE
jgi:hypothetical protein